MDSPALAVNLQTISHQFGNTIALDKVSLQVPQGMLFGLIGPDGAGKSTLLQILVSLTKMQQGSGTVLGLDLQDQYLDVRKNIGWMSQKFSLYPDLSVDENLDFFARLHGIPATTAKQEKSRLLEFTRLGTARDRQAGRLSGGMKQKLALAAALIHQPKLLVLDEPTVGVDPVTRRDFWELLQTLKAQGLTTLVSTPYMDEAALCDTLLLLHNGKTLGQGTPQALRQQIAQQYGLYAITSSQLLHWHAHQKAPAPFLHLYSNAGALTAAVPPSMDCVQVAAESQALLGVATTAQAIAPTIEDVLMISLLQQEHS